MRHAGLEGLRIDLQPPAVVGLDAAGLEPEVLGRADAAGGIEQHLGAHAPPVGQEAHRIALLVELDALHLRAEPELDAALAEVVHELVDDLAVDEFEEILARLDDRHRHVERREDRRVFDADDAGADHRQAARHVRLGGDVVAVEDVAVVERDCRRPERRRADRDDDLVAGEAVLLRAGLHHQPVRIDEAGDAGEGLDAVAGELVLQHLDLVVERHPQPDAEVLALDVLLHPVGEAVEPALAPAGKIEHRLAQGLRRESCRYAPTRRRPAAGSR